MPKAKPYSGPVDEALARQVLNSTGEHQTIGDEELLLGDALFRAAAQLEAVVQRANLLLEGNEFAAIIAEHLATKLNRRGNAEIAVTENGQVELYISYEEHPARHIRAPQEPSRKVPLMPELRAKAAKLGVEIPEELGIKRKSIAEYLEKVESGEIKAKAAKKGSKRKTKKKDVAIQTANDPPDDDPGPMSAGPDETRVSPVPESPKPAPKKRGFVKTSEAVSKPVVVSAEPAEEVEPAPAKAAKPAKLQAEEGTKPNLRQLHKESKGVDIGELLNSDPPKQ
jgi:hypothetical protein